MKSAIERLAETEEPSVGEEIGTALAVAVADLGKQQEETSRFIVEAIVKAMTTSSKQGITIAEKSPIKEWVFTVERDKNLLLTKITAKAVEELAK